MLIADDDRLVLIDWEQSDEPPTNLAPEADGTWDVEEMVATSDGDSFLRYTKYEGPERHNTREGRNGHPWAEWNVFLEWIETCPSAAELAEVFSLGRTM